MFIDAMSGKIFQYLKFFTFLGSCVCDILIIKSGSNETSEIIGDLPALFGPSIPSSGLKGLVVYTTPHDGCSPVNNPPAIIGYKGRYIALIRRFNCSFERKVLNAQNAGYDAVIIRNVGSDFAEVMNGDTNATSVVIPSVFVGEEDGLRIQNYFLYYSGYYAIITDNMPFNIQSYLLPFAIVIGICFVIFLAAMLVKFFRDYRHLRRNRLSYRALRKLETKKFKKGDPYECCAVCLEDYVNNDKLRILPCSHAYHSKCIDPWLTKNRRVCPVCKRRVITGNETLSDLETDTDDETTPLIGSSRREQSERTTSSRRNRNERTSAIGSSTRNRDSESAIDSARPTQNENGSLNGSLVDTENERAPLIDSSQRRVTRGGTFDQSTRRIKPKMPSEELNQDERQDNSKRSRNEFMGQNVSHTQEINVAISGSFSASEASSFSGGKSGQFSTSDDEITPETPVVIGKIKSKGKKSKNSHGYVKKRSSGIHKSTNDNKTKSRTVVKDNHISGKGGRNTTDGSHNSANNSQNLSKASHSPVGNARNCQNFDEKCIQAANKDISNTFVSGGNSGCDNHGSDSDCRVEVVGENKNKSGNSEDELV